MNILFLTQVLPYPLDAGPKVRAYYTLRHLAQRADITLAAFVRPTDTSAALDHLRTHCKRIITHPMPRSRLRDAAAFGRSLASSQPFLITRDRSPQMHADLASLVRQERFDAIHADQLWMAPYALAAAQAANPRPFTVLDQHNAVHLIPHRLIAAARTPMHRAALRRETALMERYEAEACLAFDRVVTVTADDQQALLNLYRNGRRPNLAAIIPICTDPQALAPAALPAAPNALFLGGMHWPPNADGAAWFAREVWPLVRAAAPRAEFWAVGKQPPAVLGAAAGTDGIWAPGYLEDPQEAWDRSRVFVVPLLAGGGMRVKILDAWARGRPVVSTTVGAEGLAMRDGENVLIANTPADFAAATLRLLSDDALANRLARAGRVTVEQHYNWRTVYRAWDDVYAAAG